MLNNTTEEKKDIYVQEYSPHTTFNNKALEKNEIFKVMVDP